MRCWPIFVIAIIVIFDFNSATSTLRPGTPSAKAKVERSLSKHIEDKIQANCQKKKNRCKGQTEEYKDRRQNVKSNLIKRLKEQNVNISDQNAEKEAEERLKGVYELKKKVHAKYGLDDVDPADDGVWQGDIILSTEQVESRIGRLENPREVPETPGDYNRLKRSASTYFEARQELLWKMPIRYWVSNDFTKQEKQIIDAAVNNISLVAPCITFLKDTAPLTTGSQIQYTREAPDCSGDSAIGYHGINTINVGPMKGSACGNVVWKGKVMHETIHALGGAHEQSRMDRGRYIEILWENIDPQQAYSFEVHELSTSYGVPYDYQSRMHYKQGAFAANPGLDTMTPVTDTELGGDYLTPNDILQLNRMYCRPSGCVDKSQYCGNWALVGQYCDTEQFGPWMRANCAKSCGAC